MRTSIRRRWHGSSMCLDADDFCAGECASVAGDRLHGYAQRLPVAGPPSSGGAAQRTAQRSFVCLPWSPQRSCEGDLARWSGSLLVHKKTRRGKFIWPSVAGEAVTISLAQLSYLLSGIDWRNPQETQRPTRVG